MKKRFSRPKSTRLFAQWHWGSVLVQILATILVFLLVSIATCLWIWAHTYRVSTREKLDAINQEIVDRSQITMDTLLITMDDAMDTLAQNTDVISMAVNPGLEDHARIGRIQQALTSSSGFGQVDAAFIYVEGLEQFLSSDEMSASRAHSRYLAIQEYHEENWQHLQGFGVGERTRSRLELLDGQLYLIRDFPRNGDNRLITIGFQCSPDALYESVIGDKVSSVTLYVVSGEGLVLLSSHSGSVGSLYDEEELAAIRSGAGGVSGGIFYQQSGYSGLTYILREDAAPIGGRALLTAIVPGVLLLIGAAVALSVYLTRKIYNPIQGLVALLFTAQDGMGGAPGGPTREKNEYALLEKLYLDLQSRIAVMGRMLDFTRPIVRERILRKLVLEDARQIPDQEYETAAAFLDIAGNLPSTGVLLLQLSGEPGPFPSPATGKADMGELLATTLAAEHLDRQGYTWDIFSTGENEAVMILQVAPESLDGDSLTHLTALAQAMEQEGKERVGMQVTVAGGSRLSLFREVHQLYGEARAELEDKLYLHSVKQMLGAGKEAPAGYGEWVSGMKKRVAAFLLYESYDELEAMLEDYTRMGPEELKISEGEKRTGYMIFLDCISAYIGGKATGPEDFPGFAQARDRLTAEISRLDGKARLPGRLALEMQELYREIREELGEIERKKESRRVAEAIAYLRRHHQDPGLSLTRVAEATGTNSAYLSKLFKQKMEVNFVDYLNRYRINRAKQWLRGTELTVQQICKEVGFLSAQNFSKVFKRVAQCTPGQYREAFTRLDNTG